MDFLKEDIKRFQLNDTMAIAIIMIGITRFVPMPFGLIFILPGLLIISKEIKANLFLYISLVLIILGAIGKVTHIDILRVSNNVSILGLVIIY